MGKDIVWHKKVGGRESREFIRATALPNKPLVPFGWAEGDVPAFDEHRCEGVVVFKDGQIYENIAEPGREPWFRFEIIWYITTPTVPMHSMGELDHFHHSPETRTQKKNTHFCFPILFNGEVWAMQPMAHPPSRKPTFGDRTRMCEAIDAYLSASDAT